MKTNLELLKQRNFLLLWLGQIVSQFGDRLTQMALIGLVYKMGPGSSMQLAKMMSLAIIPVFLISPVAGVYVDRWQKRKTMYISDISRGLFILLIPAAIAADSMILVYILIFLSYCSGRFFIPAKMAIIPSLATGDSLLFANSLFSVTGMIAAVLGFGLGGIMVEKWGVKTAFTIDALTFFVSALTILLMRIDEKGQFNAKDLLNLGKDAIKNVKNSFLHESKEGLKYLFQSKETLYSAKIMFILFAAIGSLYTVFIVFLQQSLGTVTKELGFVAVGAGAGLFLGSVLYGKAGTKLPIRGVINFSMLLASIYLCIFVNALSANPNKNFAFYSCLFLGILISPIVIAINTLIHQESENNFWGRIFSYLEVVIHLAFIIFMFTASFLAEKFSPFTVILWVGIILAAFSIINLMKDNGTRQRA